MMMFLNRYKLLAIFCFSLALLIPSGALGERIQPLGKERIFAFLYLPKGVDPGRFKSANFIQSKPEDWRDWQKKEVIPSQGKTWFNLLRNPVDVAVEILATLDYGGNPNPVVAIAPAVIASERSERGNLRPSSSLRAKRGNLKQQRHGGATSLPAQGGQPFVA